MSGRHRLGPSHCAHTHGNALCCGRGPRHDAIWSAIHLYAGNHSCVARWLSTVSSPSRSKTATTTSATIIHRRIDLASLPFRRHHYCQIYASNFNVLAAICSLCVEAIANLQDMGQRICRISVTIPIVFSGLGSASLHFMRRPTGGRSGRSRRCAPPYSLAGC